MDVNMFLARGLRDVLCRQLGDSLDPIGGLALVDADLRFGLPCVIQPQGEAPREQVTARSCQCQPQYTHP